MNHTRLTTLLLLLLAPFVLPADSVRAAADDPNTAARAELTATATAFAEAFGRGDAKALASFWMPDGDLIGIDGHMLKGREAIAADFAKLFAEQAGLSLRIEIKSLRFPTPDTAIEDGATSVLHPNRGLPSRARYTNTLVRRDGKWLLASVRESPYVPPSHVEHLRPLEWMIGEWAQDVAEGPIALASFGWSPDRNYILVARGVAVDDVILDNGTERIGWDAAAKLIRTWTFEPDGGFGEGAWTREDGAEGGTWKSRMSFVLSSGSLMTSTSVVTRVDADTITWRATEQVLDGKPMPDSPVITMKRVK